MGVVQVHSTIPSHRSSGSEGGEAETGADAGKDSERERERDGVRGACDVEQGGDRRRQG